MNHRERHKEFKAQGEGFRDKNKPERRVQNDIDDKKEATQDWLDIQEIEDEEIEGPIQTVTEVKSKENRNTYMMQKGRGFYAVYILQQ